MTQHSPINFEINSRDPVFQKEFSLVSSSYEYTAQSLHFAASYEYPKCTGDPDVAKLYVLGWAIVSENINCVVKRLTTSPEEYLIFLETVSVCDFQSFSNEERSKKYATFSHCWGENPQFIRLTTENIAQFSEEISFQDLPRNFQDAVTLCKRMQIRYLWIDSLCIIQSGEGSIQDWNFHVNEMRRIYLNSLLTIAASRAKDAEQGMFTERDPNTIMPVVLKTYTVPLDYNSSSETLVYEFDCQSGHHLYVEEGEILRYKEEPLSERAWVFQERLLSPRVVHFGNSQVFWECSGMEGVCEKYHMGLNRIIWDSFDSALPTREKIYSNPLLAKLQASCSGKIHYHQRKVFAELYCFYRFVHAYSKCQLTYPNKDKLGAFERVTENFSTLLEDSYITGVVRKHMPYALCWHRIQRSQLAKTPEPLQFPFVELG